MEEIESVTEYTPTVDEYRRIEALVGGRRGGECEK